MMIIIYKIPGDNLYRVDHLLNIKRGGVCIYYKISLQLKIKNTQYLQECINFERKFKGTLSGLRQFLATESPLKIKKNAFYFTSKALFVLKTFKFLP